MRNTLFFIIILVVSAPWETVSGAQQSIKIESNISFLVNGLKVEGTLVRPFAAVKPPIVLILHGMSGNRHGPRIKGTGHTLFAKTASLLGKKGVASLRISTGGRGGSEGSFLDMTLHRRVQEAVGAIEWISRQGGFDLGQLIILGHSQGSLIAAAVAKELQSKIPVKAVVLWAPQANALSTYRRSMGTKTLEKGLSATQNDVVSWRGASGRIRAFRTGFFQSLADFDAVQDINQFPGPVLIVTGLMDRMSPPWRAQAFANASDGITFKEFRVAHRMGASFGVNEVREVTEYSLRWMVSIAPISNK